METNIEDTGLRLEGLGSMNGREYALYHLRNLGWREDVRVQNAAVLALAQS
jgi:hypothetical protein